MELKDLEPLLNAVKDIQLNFEQANQMKMVYENIPDYENKLENCKEKSILKTFYEQLLDALRDPFNEDK